MQQLLEIATHISTPLMLGGLIIIALLIIFRAIVVPNFIPQLNQGQGATILKIIIIGFFILALVATVLGFVAFMYPAPVKPPDGYRTNLPSGLTLQQAAAHIAKTDGRGYSVEFINCAAETKNAEIVNGEIGGKDGAVAIKNLKLHVKNALTIDYDVNTNRETSRYEVICK